MGDQGTPYTQGGSGIAIQQDGGGGAMYTMNVEVGTGRVTSRSTC